MKKYLMILAALVMSVTSAFSQAIIDEGHGKGNSISPFWLTILIIVLVAGLAVIWTKNLKKSKNLIEKLTPAHFANGEGFDKETFASLIQLLQKQADKAWVFIFWPLMLGLSYVLASAFKGFIGYMLALVAILLAPVIPLILTGKINKQRKSVYKTLGITQKDVNSALQKLKKESGNVPEKKNGQAK